MNVDAPQTYRLATPEGFREFYAEALPKVYGYLFSRCGYDKSIAEDLTQEVFLAVAREIARGTRIDQPVPWIVGVARHKLVDHIRRSQVSDLTLAPVLHQSPHDEREDLPGFDISDRERINCALAAVPSPQREALILHFMDDLSVADVALLLGRSRSATESLIARGRASFKKRFLETPDEQ